jgi:uncharacterized protein YjbJ (UPF0337 family)
MLKRPGRIDCARDLLEQTAAYDVSRGEANANGPGGQRRFCLPSSFVSEEDNNRRKQFEKGDHIMKDSTKDQLEGKFHEAKGAIKQKVGEATKKPNMAADGQDEKIAGKVQKKVGQVEKVFEK